MLFHEPKWDEEAGKEDRQIDKYREQCEKDGGLAEERRKNGGAAK